MKGTIKFLSVALLATALLSFTSCTENKTNGDRIGTVTKFSKSGILFKSYELHINVTQTGMNSSTGFDCSIDRDNESAAIVSRLDSAATAGWKVKVVYHETFGWNWFDNRGSTNDFITDVVVLDRNFDKPFGNINSGNANTGSSRDTIYIVVTPSDPNYEKFFNKDKGRNKQEVDTSSTAKLFKH